MAVTQQRLLEDVEEGGRRSHNLMNQILTYVNSIQVAGQAPYNLR
jgi:hypothetical protein